MLVITNDVLPQTCLSYVAFRVAFLDTWERIVLSRQMGEPDGQFGYLTEVPFIRAVAPQVQLSLLAQTWSRHLSSEQHIASLLDEAIIYATCETAARVAEEEPSAFNRFLSGGPLEVRLPADDFLASELRSLHLNLDSRGDFLLISQFEDLPAHESRLMKKQFHIDIEGTEVFFDILGRWNVSESFAEDMVDLLSEPEIRRVTELLCAPPVSNSD